MNHLLLEVANKSQTYRKTLNLYWITIVLTVLLEYWIRRLEQTNGPDFVSSLLVQALGLAAVTGVTEMLFRYRKFQSDVLLLMVGIVYATSIIAFNPTVGIVPAIYIFPILTSVLSFNRRRILIAFIAVLVCFAFLYGLSPEIRMNIQPLYIVGIVFLYVGAALIALFITTSGIGLIKSLLHTTEAKQELLIQNILMDKLSKTDALTDLYNHKTFHEYLEKLIEQHDHNQLSLQLAILDIDNFKKINDTYGHWIGDIVLQRVARLIKETVTPNDFVARYGGEEFAVIFTEKAPEQSYVIAEQIRTRLAKTIHPELDAQAVTLSIGLQNYIKGEGKEVLFKGADASLYTAKRTGKNKTVSQTLLISDSKEFG